MDLKFRGDGRIEKKERESCLEGLRIGVVVKNKMIYRIWDCKRKSIEWE